MLKVNLKIKKIIASVTFFRIQEKKKKNPEKTSPPKLILWRQTEFRSFYKVYQFYL